jgi:mannose-6-phosphate isomerase-like protein (cupin superfamily)
MENKIALKDCPGFVAGDKSILREIFNPLKLDAKVNYSLAWFTVLPGNKTVKHSLESIEVYYILSGNGIMHINDNSFKVTKDDTIHIPRNAVQWIENKSDTESLTALALVDPPWNPKIEKVLE